MSTEHAEGASRDVGAPPGGLRAFGEYRLVCKLATGGMADIFLAKQVGPQGFERNVVIKRLLPHLAGDPDFLTMFLDEARLAARLEHPNIVHIHALGEVDGQSFLAMEYLAGEDLSLLLRTSVRRGKPVPVRLAVRIVSQAAHGLHFAHELTDENGLPLGVVHRDVSPSNLFVTYQGHVKVLDFGIAKASSQLSVTSSGVLKGKVAYMSPERARGSVADRRSDVYALGLTLYEALTLTRPFSRENELAILKAVLEGHVPRVREVRPEVSPELEAIVHRAMARPVEARYQSAAELAADLDDLLLGSSRRALEAEMRAWMQELLGEERIRSRSQLPSLDALQRQGQCLSGFGESSAPTPRRSPAPTLSPVSFATSPTRTSLPTGTTPPTSAALPSSDASPGSASPPPLPPRLQTAPTGAEPRGAAVERRWPAPAPSAAPASASARAAGVRRRRLLLAGATACLLGGLGVVGVSAQGALSSEAPTDVPGDVRPSEAHPAETAHLQDAPGAPVTAEAEPPAGPAEPPRIGPAEEQSPPPAEPPARRAETGAACATPASARAAPTGRLTLHTVPWTRVLLGRRVLGDTPVVEVALPVGRHRLRLLNPEQRIDRTITVEVREGQLTLRRLEL